MPIYFLIANQDICISEKEGESCDIERFFKKRKLPKICVLATPFVNISLSRKKSWEVLPWKYQNSETQFFKRFLSFTLWYMGKIIVCQSCYYPQQVRTVTQLKIAWKFIQGGKAETQKSILLITLTKSQIVPDTYMTHMLETCLPNNWKILSEL